MSPLIRKMIKGLIFILSSFIFLNIYFPAKASVSENAKKTVAYKCYASSVSPDSYYCFEK